MRVAVAGGTGLVGQLVVSKLSEAGHRPVVLARAVGVDLRTGQGLDQALADAAAVIDVSNIGTRKRAESIEFFSAATGHLLAAGQRAGVGHHVVLSIVGIDRVDLGYYAGKLRQEELVLAGPVPATVLRATQFHEFAQQLLGQLPGGPIAVVPSMRTQPIAAREVADALVAAVAAPPAGMAPELAGPQQESMPSMVRRLLRSQRSRRLVLSVRLPMAGAGAMAGRGLLPTEPGPRGKQTFAEWLAGELGR